MCIDCFQSYMERNNINLPHRLHDTKLIIDGSSFSKYLFYNHLSSDIGEGTYFYGGDYATYKLYVRQFFENYLAHCNVESIVVLDCGAKMQQNGDTRHSRWRNQFTKRLSQARKTCKSRDVHLHTYNIHWPSIMTVLFEVLRDLHIVHVQCAGREADDVIPVIARYYHCPVLTLDSDFLLLDLPDGVISMYKLFETISGFSSSQNYIECSIYYRESGLLNYLETKFGFKREMLPLIGPLLGYDRVDRQIALAFVKQVMTCNQEAATKFKDRLETNVRMALGKFASNFSENAVVNSFVQSTLEKLSKSYFKQVSSISEYELFKLKQSFDAKLCEIALEQSNSAELETILNEVEQNFTKELAQFEKTRKTKNEDPKFVPFYYDRIQEAFRWLSSQGSLTEAKEKLAQVCRVLRVKNIDANMKAKSKQTTEQKPNKQDNRVLQSEDFNLFMKHIKEKIPISLLYEELEPKIRDLPPDLPITQFFDKMYNVFFPQVPGIPLLFHRGLVRGITNPRLSNILNTKLELCTVLIEDYETLTNSSYACTFDLVSYFYGIILNQNDEQEVTRIYREGNRQIEMQTKPEYEINDKRLPNLEEISNLAEKKRRDWLFTIIKKVCFTCEVNIEEMIDKISRALPSQCQSVVNSFLLMTLSLIMCTYKCPLELTHSPKWNPFLRAMLSNIFLMGYIGPSGSDIPTFFDLDQDRIDVFRTIQVLPSPTIDLTISNYFNSYHNCLQSLNFLTQLLNLYECFELDRFVCGFQGSFVHAITQQFAHNDQYFESFLMSMDLPKAIHELWFEIQTIVLSSTN